VDRTPELKSGGVDKTVIRRPAYQPAVYPRVFLERENAQPAGKNTAGSNKTRKIGQGWIHSCGADLKKGRVGHQGQG